MAPCDPILDDAYAVRLVSPFWRQVAHNRLLNWIVVDKLLGPFHPIHIENILRARYAEDRLQEALPAGPARHKAAPAQRTGPVRTGTTG